MPSRYSAIARSISAWSGLAVPLPSAKATISFQPSGRGMETTVEGVSRFL
jgi:hypothetical protein